MNASTQHDTPPNGAANDVADTEDAEQEASDGVIDVAV
jgi:hypothetical protein